MGDPLAPLAARIDIVKQLHRLSEGDPLLVRLYIEELQKYIREPNLFQVEELQRLRPGLKAFFEAWFEDQRKLWGRSQPLRETRVRTVLNLWAIVLSFPLPFLILKCWPQKRSSRVRMSMKPPAN